MASRFHLGALSLALAASAWAGGAAGQVLLVADGAAPATIEHVWVTTASAPERTTVWVAVKTTEAGGRFGVVVPIRDTTRLDTGELAFVEALEQGTAPRTLPPTDRDLPACSPVPLEADVADEPFPDAVLEPLRIEHVGASEDLAAALSANGLLPAKGAVERLDSVAGGAAKVLLLYDAGDRGGVTAPLRLVESSTWAAVPFGLLRAGLAHDLRVTHVALGAEAMTLENLDVGAASDIDFRWQARSAESDYAVARERRLRAAGGRLAVREPVGAGVLYDWLTLPDGATSKSIARRYLERAVSERDVVDGCVAALVAVRAGGLVVAPSCTPGALASGVARAEPCGEVSPEAPVAPTLLGCDGADELAFAHSGLAADVMLSRHVLYLSSATPLVVGLGPDGSAVATDVVLRAASLEAADCVATGGTTGVGASSATPDPGVFVPSGGTSASGGDGVPADEGDYWYWDTTVAVEDDDASCSGSTAPDSEYSGDSCSGSTDDGEQSCSGSSDDGYSGETCGGSSDDGYSGDSCSGSSSDGYSGETCGGTTDSSGYSGETCSGDCTVTRRGPQSRPRLSFLVFLGSAALVVLRRLSRRRPK